jgi:hypothetical protein
VGGSMFEKEILVDTLRSDYSEEVIKVIRSCQFYGKSYLDVDGLNFELRGIDLLSFNSNLTEEDWYELLYELTPDIYDELAYREQVA